MNERDEFRASVRATAVTTSAAAGFGLVLGMLKGRQSAMEYASGYLVELSLSVDNLFVFIMLFEYFKVPAEYTQRVLGWGIAGAVFMRGLMIVAGVAVVKRFRWMTLLFAAILLLSSIKLLMESADGDDDDVHDNFVVRISRRLVGATAEYDGDKFFSRGSPTPLLLTLVCVELSDVVFAVDSIPAVLGISTDPFVVYSSNVFAIAGLRALYTLVARAVENMAYLKPAVCLVLAFISLKMILEYFHYGLSTGFSLSVVVFLLSCGAILSVVYKPKKRKTEDRQKNVTTSSTNTSISDDFTLHRRTLGGGGGAGAQQHSLEVYSIENDISKIAV